MLGNRNSSSVIPLELVGDFEVSMGSTFRHHISAFEPIFGLADGWGTQITWSSHRDGQL